jgi:hypothetical protein
MTSPREPPQASQNDSSIFRQQQQQQQPKIMGDEERATASYVTELRSNDVLMGRGGTLLVLNAIRLCVPIFQQLSFSSLTIVPRLRFPYSWLNVIGPAMEHEGNQTFRGLVKSRRAEYMAARRRWEKDKIAREIVALVTSHGGRFLRRVVDHDSPSTSLQQQVPSLGLPDGVTEAWVLVDEMAILNKVKQALRDQFSSSDHRGPGEEQQEGQRPDDGYAQSQQPFATSSNSAMVATTMGPASMGVLPEISQESLWLAKQSADYYARAMLPATGAQHQQQRLLLQGDSRVNDTLLAQHYSMSNPSPRLVWSAQSPAPHHSTTTASYDPFRLDHQPKETATRLAPTLNSLLNLNRQATMQKEERRAALPSPPPLLQLDLVEMCLLTVLCSHGVPLYDQIRPAHSTTTAGSINYGLTWERLSGLLVQEIQEWKANKTTIIIASSSLSSLSASSASRYDDEQNLSFIEHQASTALARAMSYIASNSQELVHATVALVTKTMDQCRQQQQHSMPIGPSSQASETLWPFLAQQLQSWSMHMGRASMSSQQPAFHYSSLSSSLSNAASSSSHVAGVGGTPSNNNIATTIVATLDVNFCQSVLNQVACMTRLRCIFQQHATEQIESLLTETLDERSAAMSTYHPFPWGANRQEVAHLDALLLQAQLLGVIHGRAGGGCWSGFVSVNDGTQPQPTAASAEIMSLVTLLRNARMTKETIEARSLQLTVLLHLRIGANQSSNHFRDCPETPRPPACTQS